MANIEMNVLKVGNSEFEIADAQARQDVSNLKDEIAEGLYTERCAALGEMVNNHHLTADTYFQCSVSDVKVGDKLYIIFKTDTTDSTQATKFQCRNYSGSPSNVVRSTYIGNGLFRIVYTVVDTSNLQILVWPTISLTLFGVSVGNGGVLEGSSVYVDGTSGDDANDGMTLMFPKKTITGALKSGNDILVNVGVYEENVYINKRTNVRISKRNGSSVNSDTAYKTVNRVIIRNPQEKLTFAVGSSGLYECAKVFDNSSNMYKVFVSETLNPIISAGGASNNAYNATIFKYDGTPDSIALKPVLTLAECQNEAETFFYDGSKVYMNTETFSGYDYMTAVGNHSAFVAEYCDGLELSGIQFEMGYGTDIRLVNISSCHNCKIVDCVGLLCAGSTNFYARMSDIDFVKCQSYRAATDGYAPVNSGTCNFYDCIGAYNKDDGVSHHQACCGVVNGGEYHHNDKGGVATPTHGAHVDIYDVYSHDNGFGIYIVASSDVPTMPVKLFDSVIKNNAVAVALQNYTVYGYNNKFDGNTDSSGVSLITSL